MSTHSAGGPWLNLAVGTLVACAVVTTALVARRELLAPPSARADARRVADWRGYAAAGPRRGPADAPVTITVFSDFQCGWCRRFAGELDTLRAERGAALAVVHRHSPLPIHPHAVQAARASECAAEQGRFWPFHDALFAAQDSIGATPWRRYAQAAGVPDLDRFDRCADDTRPLAALERDAAAAARLEVGGTPTFLVNDRVFRGALPLPALRRAVEEATRP